MVGGSVRWGAGTTMDASLGHGPDPVGSGPSGTKSTVVGGVGVGVGATALARGLVGSVVDLAVGVGVGAAVAFGVGLGVGFGVALGAGVGSAGAVMVTVPAARVAVLLSLATAPTTTARIPAGSLPDQAKVTPWPHELPGRRVIS